MTFFSTNNYFYEGYGGQNDIAMNMIDYKDFVNCLHEDNLSKAMSFKFKQATMVNVNYTVGSLVATGALSFLIARWASSPFYQGIHRNKVVLPITGVIVYWDYWRRLQRPIPRRLFTEILTDETNDGEYIRQAVREKAPNLWSYISNQLHQLNYQFPEMLETGKQIPTALLN